MLSIERTLPGVIACYADPRALVSLPSIPAAHLCRVADDEVLFIAHGGLADTARRLADHFAVVDATALVLDQSDGWTEFTLRGDEARTVFSQLSAIPLPARGTAFFQGAVAGGPAKILLLNDVVHVLVPMTLRHHVAARLRDVCGGRATVPDTETARTREMSTPTDPAQRVAAALRPA